jgi:hypothetical protein
VRFACAVIRLRDSTRSAPGETKDVTARPSGSSPRSEAAQRSGTCWRRRAGKCAAASLWSSANETRSGPCGMTWPLRSRSQHRHRSRAPLPSRTVWWQQRPRRVYASFPLNPRTPRQAESCLPGACYQQVPKSGSANSLKFALKAARRRLLFRLGPQNICLSTSRSFSSGTTIASMSISSASRLADAGKAIV